MGFLVFKVLGFFPNWKIFEGWKTAQTTPLLLTTTGPKQSRGALACDNWMLSGCDVECSTASCEASRSLEQTYEER